VNIRVAVFDDNANRRDGLKLLIDSCGTMECVGVWADCRDVLQHVTTTVPDVVLMDIDMPHVDGIEGVKRIRSQFKDIRILMQTVFEDSGKIFEAILAGADGYLLKQTSPTELLDGIVEVVNGGAPMTPAVAKKVLRLAAHKGARTSTNDFSLTERETEILKLLVDGYSYKLIAEHCGISYATVNTHVSHIYEKLQVKSAASAVSLALREGLV